MQRERRPWPPVLWEAALRKCVDPLAEGSRVTSTLDDGLRWCRQQPRTKDWRLWAFDLPPRPDGTGSAPKRYIAEALQRL